MNGAELNSLLPYNDPRCRTGLYQVLEKLVLCPSPQWPAPLSYASAVLNSGLNDPNLEVNTRVLLFNIASDCIAFPFSFFFARYRPDALKSWLRFSRYWDPGDRPLISQWKWNNCVPSSRKRLYWMVGPPSLWNLHCRHPLHHSQQSPPCPLKIHQLSLYRLISRRHHHVDRFLQILLILRSRFANPRHHRHRPSDSHSPNLMKNKTRIF